MKLSPVLVLLFASPALAAPPKVDFLFPSGGQRGQKVEMTVGGTLDPWPPHAWTSHPGLKVEAGKKSGQCTVTIAPDISLGTHWIRLVNKDGASNLRPFVVNQIAEVMEKESNDEPKKPQEVKELPTVVNGRLEKVNDTDVFAVTLKKGQTLVASVDAYETFRSPMDAVLQIVSPDGFVLAQNDDYRAMDPLIAFDAPRDGQYLVRIFCFPSMPDSRVGLHGKENCIYRLTLTNGPFVDHTWPLAVDRSKPGEVELIGWNIPSESRKAKASPEKDVSVLYLQAPGFANGYAVRVEGHAAVLEPKGLLMPPITVTGRVADAKGQAIDFEARKGSKVLIDIDAQSLHFRLDPVLIVQDPAGKQVQRVQSAKLNEDPKLEFTPTQDGKHTLLIRDLHEEGGPRHVFRVAIRPAAPDFDVTLTTDRFVLAGEKKAEAVVNLARRNSLGDEIVFTAEGLSPDIRIEYIPSKDKKTNKLVLDGVKGVNVPFRLFAQVKGRDETRRPVLSLVSDLNARVPYLWINPK